MADNRYGHYPANNFRMPTSRNYPQNGGNVNAPNGMNCGCDCKELLKKLRAIDFSIVDTVLYLDAYPECKAALEYYCKLIEERKPIAEAIKKKCGPVTIRDNGCDTWDWVKCPWPWEFEAN